MLAWTMTCAKLLLFRGRCASAGLCCVSVLGIFLIYGINGAMHSRASGNMTDALVFFALVALQVAMVMWLFRSDERANVQLAVEAAAYEISQQRSSAPAQEQNSGVVPSTPPESFMEQDLIADPDLARKGEDWQNSNGELFSRL